MATANMPVTKILRNKLIPLTAALICLVMLVACNATSTKEESQYRSIWAELYPESKAPKAVPGSIQADFFSCAQAGSLEEANRKWKNFLSQYAPEDGFYEDAVHVRYVEWAKAEVERIRLLENGDVGAEQKLIEKMKHQSDQ